MSFASQIVPYRLFVNVLVNAAASATSGVCNVTRCERDIGLTILATSVAGTADLGVTIAYSDDGVTFGPFIALSSAIASTAALDGGGGNAELTHVVDVTLLHAPFVKFRITGTGSNPADTLATITMEAREL